MSIIDKATKENPNNARNCNPTLGKPRRPKSGYFERIETNQINR